jgi:GH15 family glucan-1,4-alpha-glucosidase
MQFITEICLGAEGKLQIMYGIRGEHDLTERTLDHLSGYDGAQPVRIGNGAVKQRQNDVWGALMDSVYIHAKAIDHIRDDLWELLEATVEGAINAWPHPDQGIWEARGEPKHYVSSKIMIWVAVDRGARLARRRGDEDRAGRWRETAAEVKEEILERGVRDGIFRQHYDSDALDASTLLIPLFRFLPPSDERIRKTVLAIGEKLTRGGLMLRYLVEDTDDGLHGEEGTMLICSFWMVSALSEIGEREEARELCERLLGLAGSLDLYAEELDPASGRHLGNFPQAFTHLALINAVSHVIADAEREGEPGEKTAVFSEMRGGREEG